MPNDIPTKPMATKAGAPAWYWCRSADADEALHGPFDTKEQAVDGWLAAEGDDLRRELEDEGEVPAPVDDDTLRSMCPHVGRYRHPGVSCRVFDADLVLEDWEEHNEIAAWSEDPIEMSSELRRKLEDHLAAALYEFADKHGLWREFRGLEYVGDL